MVKKTTSQLNRESIIELQGEMKLIHNKIDTIENNHLKHIQDQVNRISWVIYTIAILILGQVFMALRHMFLGG